jgi:hypothetical protein
MRHRTLASFRNLKRQSIDTWLIEINPFGDILNVLPLTISSALNDPFEANPIVVDDTQPSDLARFMRGLWGRLPARNAIVKRANEIHRRDDPQFDDPGFQQEMLGELGLMIAYRNARCHVASFSRRISSELQWSHYANGYKGLAYHFVTAAGKLSDFHYLRSVKYSSQRPLILVSELMEQMEISTDSDQFTLNWLSFEQRSFLTKSSEWAYEEEARVIKQDTDKMRFLENELVSVVVGPRFPTDQLERLINIAKKRPRPLKIFAAKTSLTSYGIEVDWSRNLASS